MSKSIIQKPNVINELNFNRHYCGKIDMPVLAIDTLLKSSFWDNLKYLFSNPSDFVCSLYAYPFNVKDTYLTSSATSEYLYIGDGNKLGDATGYLLPDTQTYLSMGEVTIDEKFGNFLDYAPYTKLELYLPFCSIITLDTNLVMGKILAIDYSIDFDNGGCTAYISIVDGSEKTLIMTTTGQIGFQIPLGATNNVENTRNIISSSIGLAGGTITSIATENPLAFAISSLNFGKTLLTMSERVSKGGSGFGKGALNSPRSPYLIRTSPKIVGGLQWEYASYKGLPLQEERKLGNLKGFTKVERVHVDNLPTATETEKQMIEQQLLSGVIL